MVHLLGPSGQDIDCTSKDNDYNETRSTERNRYTIAQKISYVNYANLCMEEDLASMTTVADEACV